MWTNCAEREARVPDREVRRPDTTRVRPHPLLQRRARSGLRGGAKAGRRMRARRAPLGTDPEWAANKPGAKRLINARCETVHENPSFRSAIPGAALRHPGERLVQVAPGIRSAAAVVVAARGRSHVLSRRDLGERRDERRVDGHVCHPDHGGGTRDRGHPPAPAADSGRRDGGRVAATGGAGS